MHLGQRAITDGGATHAVADAGANLSGVHFKLGKEAGEGIAVHVELLGRLALIAFMLRKDFEDEAFLELLDGVGVGDAGAVHLGDEALQFALHDGNVLSLAPTVGEVQKYCPPSPGFDPAGIFVLRRSVVQVGDGDGDAALQVSRGEGGRGVGDLEQGRSQARPLDPGLRRQEAGTGHEDSGTQQAGAGKAEEGASEAIERAEASEAGGGANQTANEEDAEHDGEREEDEGGDAGGGGLRDPTGEPQGEGGVVPGGDDDAGQEGDESEELADQTAQETADDGPESDGQDEPVKGGEGGEERGWGRGVRRLLRCKGEMRGSSLRPG